MQFDHRLLATATVAVAMVAVILGLALICPAARAWIVALGALVLLQYALGVATLLLVVPIALAAAHQANAVLMLTVALIALHTLRPAPARRARRLGQVITR